jgi:hypothetical protein
MFCAGRLLNKDTNMSAWFEENQELMLMTCPSPPKAKQRWQLYFRWLSMFTGRPVGIVGDWRWCEDHVCKFESHYLNRFFFNVCVAFAQIGLLITIVHLLYYLSVYVSKLPCGTHTKSNWKWILKFADCDARKIMSNSAREAGIYFISPWLIVHRHSDLKVPCSNLTIGKRFYLQKHILYNCFYFENYINDL